MLRRLIRNFWQDDGGAVDPQFALIASVLVLGSVVGLLAVRGEIFGPAFDVDQTANAVQTTDADE